ncbi:hypothetical protein [uncultured Ruminococcus sp.]|uniref:hypothetical protein n=1 Tax=Ruminococcus sp. TaxID=41978 RepID=UPI000AECD8EC|nr:hypothetical protein [uncultured Ruminococcus sp.]
MTFAQDVHISENVRNSGTNGAEKGKTAPRFRQKLTPESAIIDLSEIEGHLVPQRLRQV